MADTLPEITIVGDPGSPAVTAGDWFAEGFIKGWDDPYAKQEPPAPLDKIYLAAYYAGMTAGSMAKRGVEKSVGNDGRSGIRGPIDGKAFKDFEREYREAWEEFLRHEDPHDESKLPEIQLGPGTL